MNQVYNGITCPAGPAFLGLCDLGAGTPVDAAPRAGDFMIANFDLGARVDAIFRDGFDR